LLSHTEEKHRQKFFEKWVLTNILVPDRDKVSEDLRKPRNEALENIYTDKI
jgi:hypothetical protein